MSVTFHKLAERIQDKLQPTAVTLSTDQIQLLLRLACHEIGDALSSGEDVFLDGFGRFYPDFKPQRKVKSGLTKSEHVIRKKVFVRFSAFSKLTEKVQAYIKALGLSEDE